MISKQVAGDLSKWGTKGDYSPSNT